jgi:hypothetical protein
MRSHRLFCALILTSWVCACSNNDGTRDECAEGAALNQCPDSELTPQGACWRLVDCGAIDLESQNNHFDWTACYERIETAPADEQQLVIDCIAASSCDSLKVDGSPNNPDTGNMTCLVIGGLQ